MARHAAGRLPGPRPGAGGRRAGGGPATERGHSERAPEAGFFADLNADWSVWGPLTLTANLVASVSSALDEATGETRRLLEGGGSLAFSWQALDVLGLYVQSYALKQEGGDWRVHLGGGLTWRVAPRVQLDLSADARLTDQGDPPTLGAGTTILW